MAATVPLNDLQQNIASQEEQLRQLRDELKARQQYLNSLHRQKLQLEGQLEKLAQEIDSVTRGEKQPPAVKPGAARKKGAKGKAAKKSAAPAPKAPAAGPAQGSLQGLPGLVAEILAGAGRPLSLRELTDAVEARNYASTSKNLYGMVKKASYKLLDRGYAERTADGSLVPTKGTPTAPAAAKAAPAPASNGTSGAAPAPAAPAKPENIPLKDRVVTVLKRSKRPLPSAEIAARILAGGYQTASKDFNKLVAKTAGTAEEVERVPGVGYQLKK